MSSASVGGTDALWGSRGRGLTQWRRGFSRKCVWTGSPCHLASVDCAVERKRTAAAAQRREQQCAGEKKNTEKRKSNNEKDAWTHYSSPVTKLVFLYLSQWRRIVYASDLKVSSWLKRDRAVSLRRQDTSRRGREKTNRHSWRIKDPQFIISDHQFIRASALVCVVISGTSVCPQSSLGSATKVKNEFIYRFLSTYLWSIPNITCLLWFYACWIVQCCEYCSSRAEDVIIFQLERSFVKKGR